VNSIGDAPNIALWCSFFEEITDESLLRKYQDQMSPPERQQADRFLFAKDRHRYLVTRGLVRTVLSRYVSIEPHELLFTTNSYGRPALANAASDARSLTFNVTHTDGLIILAVAHGGEVGVDAENIRTRAVSIDIADRYFAPEEVRDLRALPDSRRVQRFFEYWTLKESYIKARGMGLSIPLHQFVFRLPAEQGIEISIDPRQGDSPHHSSFWQFSLERDQYIGALCARHSPAERRKLIMRRIIPLGPEREQSYVMLRTSS
jgi:4'-phosphopantetheinyl transferase